MDVITSFLADSYGIYEVGVDVTIESRVYEVEDKALFLRVFLIILILYAITSVVLLDYKARELFNVRWENFENLINPYGV